MLLEQYLEDIEDNKQIETEDLTDKRLGDLIENRHGVARYENFDNVWVPDHFSDDGIEEDSLKQGKLRETSQLIDKWNTKQAELNKENGYLPKLVKRKSTSSRPTIKSPIFGSGSENLMMKEMLKNANAILSGNSSTLFGNSGKHKLDNLDNIENSNAKRARTTEEKKISSESVKLATDEKLSFDW